MNAGFTPTEEDEQRANEAVRNWHETPGLGGITRRTLATIGPIIERERRAAKVEGYRLALELAEDAVRVGEDHGLHECPDCEDDFAAIRDAVRLPIADVGL